MIWTNYVLPSALALILGLAAACLNTKLSAKMLDKTSLAEIMGVNVIRLVIDAIVLALIYLLCRLFKLPMTAPLLSCAAALSVGGMLMLKKLTDKIKKQQPDAKGGE